MKKLLLLCFLLMGCGSTDNVDSTPLEPDSSFVLPDSGPLSDDSASQDDVVILTQPDAPNNLELDAANITDASNVDASYDAALDHKEDSRCEHKDCGEDDRDCHHHNECCNK